MVSPMDIKSFISYRQKYTVSPMMSLLAENDPEAMYVYIDYLFTIADYEVKNNIRDSLTAFKTLLMNIDSIAGDLINTDTSHFTRSISEMKKSLLDILSKDVMIDSLRRHGIKGLYAVKERNHYRSGLQTKFSLPLPLGNLAPKIPAYIDIAPDGRVKYLSDSSLIPDNIPIDILNARVPTYVTYLPIGCKADQGISSRALRSLAQGNRCTNTIEAIKWINNMYPDINVIILSHTGGHFQSKAVPNPYEEAEIIRYIFQDFYGLQARIIMGFTEYYTLPHPDSRRDDIVNPISQVLHKWIGRDVIMGDMYLFDVDGKAVALHSPGQGFAIYTKSFLDAFYDHYRKVSEHTDALNLR